MVKDSTGIDSLGKDAAHNPYVLIKNRIYFLLTFNYCYIACNFHIYINISKFHVLKMGNKHYVCQCILHIYMHSTIKKSHNHLS